MANMTEQQSTLIQRVDVDLAARSYPIHIGQQLLGDTTYFAPWLQHKQHRCAALIVSNEVVAPLYADTLRATLEAAGASAVHVVVLPDGEHNKDWQHLQGIFDALMAMHADRGVRVFALGGGVVGDMAGFAAACFMRGVPFVQVPTSLLAQVDSSVGGKTGINHPLGKNMIGAFHQPLAVVIDVATLQTLPARQLSCGFAEMIKHAAIMGKADLDALEFAMPALRALDVHALSTAIARSCAIKAEIVKADEREQGIRAYLNFGHTFGHAVETGLGYGQWLHGEAVAVGMVVATALSVRLGLIPPDYLQRLTALLIAAGLPTQPPANLPASAWLSLMAHDKKAEAGSIRYVLLEDWGKPVLRPVPAETVIAVLHAFGCQG